MLVKVGYCIRIFCGKDIYTLKDIFYMYFKIKTFFVSIITTALPNR